MTLMNFKKNSKSKLDRKEFYEIQLRVKNSFAHKKIERAHRYMKSDIYVCINNR